VLVGFVAIFLTAAVLCALGWGRTYRRLVDRSREHETQERSWRLLEEERRILELAAQGASLKQVLDALTAAIERMPPGAFCSILLLDEDGVHLRVGSSGALPADYIQAADGIPIGPDMGCCGSAGFRNQSVIASDISTDYRWRVAKEPGADVWPEGLLERSHPQHR
jgi:GAF domain-containing protein